MCLECIENRKYKNSIFDKIYDYQENMPDGASMDMPFWMGNKEFHASHRSKLLFKGRCDSVLTALKTYFKYKTLSQVKFWLVSDYCSVVISDFFVKTNILSQKDLEQIEEWIKSNNIEIQPNHYLQFKWEEPDNLPYIWPVTKAKLQETKLVCET